jgi:transposase-like protein
MDSNQILCKHCGSADVAKWGTQGSGKQRYKCRDCTRRFAVSIPKTIDTYPLELYESGMSTTQIANQLGITQSSVMRQLQKIPGFVPRKKGSGK